MILIVHMNINRLKRCPNIRSRKENIMSCLFHKWDGCRCVKCRKTRDIEHRWRWEAGKDGRCHKVCPNCGKSGEVSDHQWVRVPGTCTEKCSNCGTIREAHRFTSIAGVCKERCTICGKIHEIEHVFEWDGCRGTCTKCGYQTHKWNQITINNMSRNGCKCTVCGEINPAGVHTWETIGQTGEPITEIIGRTGNQITKRCTVCGKTDTFYEWTSNNKTDILYGIPTGHFEKSDRSMEEELIYQDSLHDMRAHGIKC